MCHRVRTISTDNASAYSPTEYLLGVHENPSSSLELYMLVREGFLLDCVISMASSSQLFKSTDIVTRIVGHSVRGMMRQRKAGVSVRLNIRQSTVAFQYAQSLELALKVFGSQQTAEEWFELPCKFLAGYVPLDMVEHWSGFLAVKEYLERIVAGVYH